MFNSQLFYEWIKVYNLLFYLILQEYAWVVSSQSKFPCFRLRCAPCMQDKHMPQIKILLLHWSRNSQYLLFLQGHQRWIRQFSSCLYQVIYWTKEKMSRMLDITRFAKMKSILPLHRQLFVFLLFPTLICSLNGSKYLS